MIANAGKNKGAELIVKNANKLTALNCQMIASANPGHVHFDFTKGDVEVLISRRSEVVLFCLSGGLRSSEATASLILWCLVHISPFT